MQPLKNDFLDPSRRKNLWLLLITVTLVLLIACVNISNLLLARGAGRQRELALRAALGASGSQLFWQLLMENLTLAGLGGALGVFSSGWLVKVIPAILPPGTLSSEADIRLSAPVLLFTLATTFLSAVLFGYVPALQARKADLNNGLKQGGRAAISAGHPRLRQSLVVMVVIEFALALTLLAAGALTIHSFMNRMHVDLGIRTDHILTFYLPVPNPGLHNLGKQRVFTANCWPGLKQFPVSSARQRVPIRHWTTQISTCLSMSLASRYRTCPHVRKLDSRLLRPVISKRSEYIWIGAGSLPKRTRPPAREC